MRSPTSRSRAALAQEATPNGNLTGVLPHRVSRRQTITTRASPNTNQRQMILESAERRAHPARFGTAHYKIRAMISVVVFGLLLHELGHLERAEAMMRSNAISTDIERPQVSGDSKANNKQNQNQMLTVIQVDSDRRPEKAKLKQAPGDGQQQQQQQRRQLENVMRLAMLTAASKTAESDHKSGLQMSSTTRKHGDQHHLEQQQQQQHQQVDVSLDGFEPQTRTAVQQSQRPEVDLADFEQNPAADKNHHDYNQVSLGGDERQGPSSGTRAHEFGPDQSEFRLADDQAIPEVAYPQRVSGRAKPGSAHIRVVFNNNPQFIIGSSAGEAPAGVDRLPLQRRIRQPSPALYDEQYNSDESAPAETKLSVLPCAKEQRDLPAGKLGGLQPPVAQSEEQLNLIDKDGPVSIAPEPREAATGRSKPPPANVKLPDEQRVSQEAPQEVVLPAQQQQEQQQTIESHSIKFDQMAKSGLRPPLRMVISMENNQGEFMKVPINLPGSLGSPGKTFEAGPQVKIQIRDKTSGGKTAVQEQAVDEENTPQGGDIFEPSLAAKPGPVMQTKQTSDQKQVVQQQQQQQQQVAVVQSSEEPAPVFKTTREDCQQRKEMAPVEQQAKVEPIGGSVIKQRPVVVDAVQQQVDTGQKAIQMSVPQLNELQNKTFTDMISQFQKALSDQMSKHFETKGKTTGDNYQEPAKRPEAQQQQQPEVQRPQHPQQQADDQDDLVVALMAANMRQPSGGSDASVSSQMFQGPGRQQVSMTVIRPPKGTSIEEAVMRHAKEGQTMAIISSRLPSLESQEAMTQPAAGGANGMELQAPPPPSSTTGDPSGADPDGFSSSSSEALESSTGQLQHHPLDSMAESLAQLQIPFEWHQHQTRTRFKRDAPRDEDERRASKRLAKKTVAKKQTKPAPKRRAKSDSKNKARDRGLADHMQGAASQTEASLASDGSDEEDDVDDDEAIDGGGSSSSDGGNNSDEPAQSATGEVGQSTSGSAPDDGDYNGDLGDDFDDSTAFDADDEPYNTAAASDRDYSGAFKSFEIPSIDINPDTLKQKGCRTVLREVQEIPMNGLGAVQANGQPGSGYQTGDTLDGQLGATRVKRHVATGEPGNKNLINSRKVTSIVMTKECHFPSEQTDGNPLPIRRQPARVAATHQRPAGQQQVAVSSSADGRVSESKPSLGHPSQTMPHVPSSRQAGFHQTQVRVRPASVVANFYSNPKQRPVAQAAASQLIGYQLTAPADVQQKQQHQQKQQLDQIKASSSIRRRSVASSHPAESARNLNSGEQTAMSSVANGVVARKLYKPPSDDDPYHTLSYSSQNGADPDMDQDEDDSVVMGADDSQAESRRDAAQKKPRGTLSERERAALMDPNHDDTDPVQRNKGGANSADAPAFDSVEPSDEADESDGDLSDESRPSQVRKRHRQRAPLAKIKRPQASENQIQSGSGGKDADDDEIADRADDESRYRPPLRPPVPTRSAKGPAGKQRQSDQPFGRSFRFEHELSKPSGQKGTPSAVSGHLRQLSPGLRAYVNTNGRKEPVRDGGQLANQLKTLAATPTLSRRQDMDMDDDDDDDDDEAGDNRGGRGGSQRSPAASARNEAQDDNPDADPELNPHEIHLPAHSQPKKLEKSFAYVHRDLPKKGAKNPDDFVVSYGRGNLQTEHEDYDSDRDHNNAPPPSEADEQDRAASNPRRTKVLGSGRLLVPASRRFGMRHSNNSTISN